MLVDSPPLLPVSDARLIAPHASGVIIVVAAGTSKPSALQSAIEKLDLAGASLLGVVLNQVGSEGEEGSSYYYPYKTMPTAPRPVEGHQRARRCRCDDRPPARRARGDCLGDRDSAGLALAASRSPLIAVAVTVGALVLWCMFTWAHAVLLLLVAILPWEEMLLYPSETVSLVKIVGLLLMIAYLFRALGTREQLVLPWTLRRCSCSASSSGCRSCCPPIPPTASERCSATRCSSSSSS